MYKLGVLWLTSLFVSCHESYKYSLHHNNEGAHFCSTMSSANKSIAFVRSVINCAGHCSLDTNCKSFNYRRLERICQLFYNFSNSNDFVIDYVIDDVGCSHYEKVRSASLLFICIGTRNTNAMFICIHETQLFITFLLGYHFVIPQKFRSTSGSRATQRYG